MHKWSAFVLSVVLVLIACDRGELKARGRELPEKLYYAAPTGIPHTTPDMKNAGFWISRHPYPDRVISGREGIVRLNASIANEKKLLTDIAAMKVFDGEALRTRLAEGLNKPSLRKMYDKSGEVVSQKFHDEMERSSALSSIPEEIKIIHGIITSNTAVRHLPADEPLYEEAGDVNFDELQNDAFDIGMPVAILHKSPDGRWLYVEGAAAHGWIRREAVAAADTDQFKIFADVESPAVVIAPKAELYLSPALKDYHSFILMGDTLPLKAEVSPGVVEVLLPVRSKNGALEISTAYMEREDVNIGFLPYTPRIILKQAFAMLNAPYGWGGMYGEQDCSRMLQMIFGTVGIRFPRDSWKQKDVGSLIGRFEKLTADRVKYERLLREGVPGATILHMKGHIILYLGEVDGRFYAIHETWGYREPDRNGEDRVRAINRVAVTDLSLGEGSKKGSLIQRTSTIRVVK